MPISSICCPFALMLWAGREGAGVQEYILDFRTTSQRYASNNRVTLIIAHLISINVACFYHGRDLKTVSFGANKNLDACKRFTNAWISLTFNKCSFDSFSIQRLIKVQKRNSHFPVGGVAEWSNAPVLKTGVRESVPWVRIPPLPPFMTYMLL